MSNNNEKKVQTVLFSITNGKVGLICKQPGIKITQIYRDPDSVFFEIETDEDQKQFAIKEDPKETIEVELLKMMFVLLNARCKLSIFKTALKASKLNHTSNIGHNHGFASWLFDSMFLLMEKKEDPVILDAWKSTKELTLALDRRNDAWTKFFDAFEARFMSKNE